MGAAQSASRQAAEAGADAEHRGGQVYIPVTASRSAAISADLMRSNFHHRETSPIFTRQSNFIIDNVIIDLLSLTIRGDKRGMVVTG